MTASATASPLASDDFDAIDRLAASAGPAAAIDHLVATLEGRREYRALLDALLLRARLDLGLPLISTGAAPRWPEPARSAYEERYVEAIRRVGGLFAGRGRDRRRLALLPGDRRAEGGRRGARPLPCRNPATCGSLDQMIEVAFNQGANPRRGFELILDNYGACSAITSFEHLPHDESARLPCADRLVRHLHEALALNLRAEVERREGRAPDERSTIADLLDGRDWIMADDAYHIDTSHLAATVRVAPMLTDPETIALAVGLTDYGRRLSPMHRYESDPPFDQLYEDHGVYLRGLCSARTSTGRSPTSRRSSRRTTRTARARATRCRPRCSSASCFASGGWTGRSTWRPSTWPASPKGP